MLRNRVREFRELHQLSQEELAQSIDVTMRTIIRIEVDPQYLPSCATMLKLANYFNVRLGVLFDTEPRPVGKAV